MGPPYFGLDPEIYQQLSAELKGQLMVEYMKHLVSRHFSSFLSECRRRGRQ